MHLPSGGSRSPANHLSFMSLGCNITSIAGRGRSTTPLILGVAGPSGYGSNSTAEQVTQQDCSFLLPSSQAQLTALVTEMRSTVRLAILHLSLILTWRKDIPFTLPHVGRMERLICFLIIKFYHHSCKQSKLRFMQLRLLSGLRSILIFLGVLRHLYRILRNNNISGSIPSNIGDYQRLLQLNNKKEGIAWDNLCPCTLWNMGIKTRWHCFSSL
ncbi:unnamed protein product [Camellia sinensis]